METRPSQNFVLGIDLGSNSLGWAMIGLEDGKPAKLLRAGVRVFEAGTEGDIESGQEESRNKARREARMHRRQLWRRARRLKKVFKLLQSYGLLPAVPPPFRAAPAFVALAFRPADGGLKPTATSDQWRAKAHRYIRPFPRLGGWPHIEGWNPEEEAR
jgi:hypothetical protein